MASKNPSGTEQNDSTNGVRLFPGLTPNQVLAVLHIGDGASNAEVANLLGVDRTTVWRWRKIESFEVALNVVQLRALEEMQRAFVAHIPTAIETLVDLLLNGSDSVRLSAAKDIINRATETEIGYQDVASVVRADAQRVHPNFPDISDEMLRLLVRPDYSKPEDDSEVSKARHEYFLKKMKELGIDIDKDL